MGIERIATEVSQFRAIQTDWELARKIAENSRQQLPEGQNPSVSGELNEVDILSPEGRESYARLAVLSRQVSRRLQEEADAALRREEAAQQAEEQRQEREERARQAAEDAMRDQEKSAAASDEDKEAGSLPDTAAQAASGREETGQNGANGDSDAARTGGPSDAAVSPADGETVRETVRQTPLHLVV